MEMKSQSEEGERETDGIRKEREVLVLSFTCILCFLCSMKEVMLLWPSSFPLLSFPLQCFLFESLCTLLWLRLKAEKRRVGEKRKRQPTKKSQQKMMTEKRMGDKVFEARKRGEEMTREEDGDDRE